MSETEIKGILGTKLGMTQIFDESNRVVPVTVVEAGPCVVTQIRTVENDGYNAIQIAYGEIDPRKAKKPQAGHFKKAGVTPRRHMAEIRMDDVSGYEGGQDVTGACATPGRVFKGTRMAGRMGSDRVTTQNLKIQKIDTEANLLIIKGAIPGARGGLVTVKTAVKGGERA